MGLLRLHLDCRCPAVAGIEADAARPSAGRLLLRYRLTGALREVVLPARTPPLQVDELWRHTCFEAFVRGPSGEAYVELNLAPSTQWAAYRFLRYRAGMTAVEMPAPKVDVRLSHDRVELSAEVDLSAVGDVLPQAPWRLGLAAVTEEAGGRLSYWALRHPPGRPDFHHPDCFALELPAPEQA